MPELCLGMILAANIEYFYNRKWHICADQYVFHIWIQIFSKNYYSIFKTEPGFESGVLELALGIKPPLSAN